PASRRAASFGSLDSEVMNPWSGVKGTKSPGLTSLGDGRWSQIGHPAATTRFRQLELDGYPPLERGSLVRFTRDGQRAAQLLGARPHVAQAVAGAVASRVLGEPLAVVNHPQEK